MRFLSLFSGIGAFDLGLTWAGWQVAGQCEIDPFCRRVLEKQFPGVPRWNDVTALTGKEVLDAVGSIDALAGGFPCQDISAAGKGAGIHGERSGLYWQLSRLVAELRPRWLLLENVPALRTRGADEVLADLEGHGYACWPLVVGADDVGAPHRRKRVWIVAYRHGIESERRGGTGDLVGSAGAIEGDEVQWQRNGYAAFDCHPDVGNTASKRERKSSDEANAISVGRNARGVVGGTGIGIIGAWPTPMASDGRSKGIGGFRNTLTLAYMAKSGQLDPANRNTTGSSLAWLPPMGDEVEQEAAEQHWRTPEAWDEAMERGRMTGLASEGWPTPTVSGNHNRKGASAASGDGLATAVNREWPTPRANRLGAPDSHGQSPIRGVLNPAWVTQLMGLPDGWMDVEPTPELIAELRAMERATRKKKQKRKALLDSSDVPS